MNKMIYLLITIMLLPGALALNTLVAKGSALDASLLYYSPLPAEPGDVLDVYIMVANSGGEAARNVQVKMLDNYPFSSDNPENSIKDFKSIPGQESQLVRFKVRVDKDAPEGTGYLKLQFGAEGSQGMKDKYLEVDVLTNDAAIGIDRIVTTPKVITPGGQGKIEIFLKNLADSRLRDVAISLATEKTVGTTTVSVPFAPVGTSLERRFSELLADQEMKVTYDIIISPGAESDVYEIPITITFSDESGNDYSVSDEVALIVNAKPELDVYIDETNLFTDQLNGEITIKFVNKGLATIKSLSVDMEESEDYDLLASSKQVYIGNIDSDDYETTTIQINAHTSDFKVPVTVEYLDALNNEYAEQKDLEIHLFSMSASNNGNGGSSTVIILVAIGAIALIIVYRIISKRRKKRK